MSVGRRPVTKGFGLENLNLEQTERGAIRVNEKMQTSVPDVYVCGDLTGFSLLAHTAVREAEVAVHSILGKEDAMSYRAIPGVVYTNPEIAGVGETEESASTKGINYQVIKLPMAYSGRFVAENEGVNGVCKVLLDEQQRVIGAHVLGNPASEIITLAGTAIELGLTAAQWKKIVFPHPTVGEIFREGSINGFRYLASVIDAGILLINRIYDEKIYNHSGLIGNSLYGDVSLYIQS